ncbi:MAG: hypothetical protein RMJ53_06250 [Chitinophagales bacterium]|nr:hypothetical protein [Chitinophagales bacterium]
MECFFGFYKQLLFSALHGASKYGAEGKGVDLYTEFVSFGELCNGDKVLPKAGVTGHYDTFVLNRTLVFQINSSAPRSPRQHAKQ